VEQTRVAVRGGQRAGDRVPGLRGRAGQHVPGEADPAAEDPARIRGTKFANGLEVVLDGPALRLPLEPVAEPPRRAVRARRTAPGR
jgi:hypothetical protein